MRLNQPEIGAELVLLDAKVGEKANERVDGLVVINENLDRRSVLPCLLGLQERDIVHKHLVAERRPDGCYRDAVECEIRHTWAASCQASGFFRL